MATVLEARLWKVMRDAKVQPWWVTYYRERRDEEIDSRDHDMIVVCRQFSLCFGDVGEVWADCVDAEGGPIMVQRDHEYRWLGVWSHMAGIDLSEGVAKGARHRNLL